MIKPPFPRALYGCAIRGCAEEDSHFPEDLVMVTNPPEGWDPGWYCESCADEAQSEDPCTQIGMTLLKALKEEKLHQFQNRLRILRSIDSWEVSGLSDLVTFIRSPYEFFIRCSDSDADLIFEALLKREPSGSTTRG